MQPHQDRRVETTGVHPPGASSHPDGLIRISPALDRRIRVAKRGPRIFVTPLGAGDDVLVNGERIAPDSEFELTRYDDLNVAGTAVVLGLEHFLGNSSLGIDTTRLRYVVPAGGAGRVLCDGLYLRAQPGSFTAILGPSGCGKTVFLRMLSGYTRPTEGRIFIGRRYESPRDHPLLSTLLGYVPQEDVMLPELTVGQSLDYRLRLRFSDMAASVRSRLIREACRQVGVDPGRTNRFLETVIGSAESGRQGLSGGERKRASIAHELLLKPLILILDEPTSGLSSVDAECLIQLLGQLASQHRITVVATVHQPSRTVFDQFEDLLVLSHGGGMAYYGPASSAKDYLERAAELPCPAQANPAEFCLSLVGEPEEARRLVRHYQSAPLVQPLSARDEPPPSATPKPLPSETAGPGAFRAQVRTLLARNLSVLRSDRANLALTFGQVPLIGLLILLTFGGIRSDNAGAEVFTRKAYLFSGGKDRFTQENQPVPVDDLLEQANREGETPAGLISLGAARSRGGIYFVLVASSLWLGILSGCREIVAERHVVQREYRTGLKLAPYLAAKALAQAGQTGLQTAFLVLLVVPWLLRQPAIPTVGLWAMLWLTAVSAASLGLMVSSLAPSFRFALTAVPLLMIPQIVLGGVLRPEVDMAKGRVLPRILGGMTLQRWGFEATLAMDTYAKGGVMVQVFEAPDDPRYGAMDLIQFREGTLPECFFAEKSRLASVLLGSGSLAAGSLLFLGVAHRQLARRLTAFPNPGRLPNRVESCESSAGAQSG
ncbi:MAG TPA: ATP-binding cassette domain-containing protein [Verrucomicrobiota bacterium]|nr:ATP-binding cassette domain-containing protein [Verrucomicrobiota bacterium]HNU51615.1 ATP-binding cassette domain-containing protein [Verrucomicrobiota bacterium]